MIEREFIAQKTKEYYIRKFVESRLSKVGVSQVRMKKIPLGEKIIILTSKPSLVVGSRGANIKDLTRVLKTEFKLENPQIEIEEVKNIYLDPKIVAEHIASSLERFGSARFKGVGHKMMENVMNSGALGVEIFISGKLPSARARSWRFYQGYLKKCGDMAIEQVRKATTSALLKSGMIGIKVAIMPPDVKLPDNIEILDEPIMEVVKEVPAATGAEKVKKVRKRPPRKKEAKAEKKDAQMEKKEAESSQASPTQPLATEVPLIVTPVSGEAPQSGSGTP